MNKNNKFGFTLVELLAVIVILAIILVIAVPKVMSVIEDAKKATLESTAKMIASAAEKAKVQNTVLGKEEEITCKSVAKINDVDYVGCTVEFDNNGKALVTIIGSGKFEGFNVCKGTKSSSKAVEGSCSLVELIVNVGDGNANKNYEEKYESGVTLELAIPTKEGYTFKEWKIVSGENASIDGSTLIVGTTNTEVEAIYNGNEYTIAYELDGGVLGENSPIKGAYGSEITIPNPSKEGWLFVGWETLDGKSVMYEDKLTIGLCNATLRAMWEANFGEHITYLLANESSLNNGLINPKVTYNSKEYDTGIRYTGANPNNYVYYNCEDKDSNNIGYGEEGYNYKSSCEVWRIIGVFNTKTTESSDAVPRVKLINRASTFSASWDSSEKAINIGFGINQWGESTYSNGTTYEGADLMQLLNGFYIGKSDSTCKYCNNENQAACNEICSSESLKSAKMKVLTSTAKRMIENAVWDTYAVHAGLNPITSSNITDAYLQEKGISHQYNGKLCNSTDKNQYSQYPCNDKITRTTSWTGLVGLMSVSDITYADGWLYVENYADPWSITPYAGSDSKSSAPSWNVSGTIVHGNNSFYQHDIFPSLYLKSTIKITSGNGTENNPYKLAI